MSSFINKAPLTEEAGSAVLHNTESDWFWMSYCSAGPFALSSKLEISPLQTLLTQQPAKNKVFLSRDGSVYACTTWLPIVSRFYTTDGHTQGTTRLLASLGLAVFLWP